MKRREIPQMVPITGATAEEFAENFNRAQRELADQRTEVIYNFNGSREAYLIYTETKTIAEDLRDEYELRGEVHYCTECPYLDRIADGRVRHHPCRMGRTTLDSRACDYYYRMLEKGEIDG